MEIKANIDLQPFNTFGIKTIAKQFGVVNQVSDWESLIQKGLIPSCILGGGSNILFVEPVQDFIVKNNILGKEILEADEDFVLIEVGSGEIWHDFVVWSLEQDYGGLENLSLIPGTVGAAPIQNIGAYGVEQKDLFHSLTYIDLLSGEKHQLSKEDCQFGYRESIFKHALKGKIAILHVTYQLSKRNHVLHTQYGRIAQDLEESDLLSPTPLDVHQVIIDIRQSKLPDPKTLGNAGSFFKNPIISTSHFDTLRKQYADMPHYPLGAMVKIPAAWLIESCGWKGYKKGDIGVYAKHALILINYGSGSGAEIKDLALAIIDAVKQKFGIEIIPEVTFL